MIPSLTVRFIPSWFPGGLKRRASWIRSMTREMYDRPYAQAKANIVSWMKPQRKI